MPICKEILYFNEYIFFWMDGEGFHFFDDEMDLIKVVNPEDEYTFLLNLREESIYFYN